MRLAHSREDFAFRAGVGTVGGVLLASAGLAADLARDHMIVLGTVCGANPTPHCGWCLGAASLALAGLAAFVMALAPTSRRVARPSQAA